MKHYIVKVLYHPRKNIMGLWRDINFPYEIFSANTPIKGWNVWINIKHAKEAGWVVICNLDAKPAAEEKKE